MSVPLWSFHAVVSTDRQERLFGWHGFDNVVGALILGSWVKVVAFRWAPAVDAHLTGCFRAEFLLEVGANTYDGFFNSPVGYRAQYAISSSNGIARNRELLDSMIGLLVANVGGNDENLRKRIGVSLSASQAKIWIDEEEVREHYFASEPEIAFERWNTHPLGDAGSRAPVGSRLVVYGGWLNSTGREVSNPHKFNRAQDIYERGFS